MRQNIILLHCSVWRSRGTQIFFVILLLRSLFSNFWSRGHHSSSAKPPTAKKSTVIFTWELGRPFSAPRTTDTQWRHKSNKSENLGRCGRQNMLWPYLKIWEWEMIFSRAVKVISSPGVRSPWSSPFTFHYGNESESSSKIPRNPAEYASQMDRVITKDD